MRALSHTADIGKAIRLLRGAIVRWAIMLAGGRCGRKLRIEGGFRLRHGFHSGINFGENVYFGKGITIDCPLGASIDIGSNVTLTQGVFISAATAVSIGDDCLVGEYVSLRDANHTFDDTNILIRLQPMDARPIVIGDNCWIGRGACILRGVNVAEGNVIGANSVVTSSTEKNSVLVGAPARLVRLRGSSRLQSMDKSPSTSVEKAS